MALVTGGWRSNGQDSESFTYVISKAVVGSCRDAEDLSVLEAGPEEMIVSNTQRRLVVLSIRKLASRDLNVSYFIRVVLFRDMITGCDSDVGQCTRMRVNVYPASTRDSAVHVQVSSAFEGVLLVSRS